MFEGESPATRRWDAITSKPPSARTNKAPTTKRKTRIATIRLSCCINIGMRAAVEGFSGRKKFIAVSMRTVTQTAAEREAFPARRSRAE